MTIVRPQSVNPKLSRAIGGSVFTLIAVSILLVMFYNRSVDTSHAISKREAEIRVLETQTAEMKEKIFSLFVGTEAEARASEFGLVKERAPKYFEVDPGMLVAARASE